MVSPPASRIEREVHARRRPRGYAVTHHDDQTRQELLRALPDESEETPLAAELSRDAKRRINLMGARFPRPSQTRILTVANQKGGVGKTTTTVNLAAALAQAGLHVLVIDIDPQGNASTALGIDHASGTASTYQVLIEDLPLADAASPAPGFETLEVLPATIDLSGAEVELVFMEQREYQLRHALRSYLVARAEGDAPRLDYILIDCPPSLGLLTINAFVAAAEVLIPIQAEYYALEGLGQLLNSIGLIQQHLNPALKVSTILLTMYDGRTNLALQVAEDVRTHFEAETLHTVIPRSVRVSEAPGYGQTVITYDAHSSGALAYREAAKEIAEAGVSRETSLAALVKDEGRPHGYPQL